MQALAFIGGVRWRWVGFVGIVVGAWLMLFAMRPDVDLRASFASRVTRNQLARIAAATTLEAYVTDAEYRSPVYVHSIGEFAEWRQF